MVKVGQEVVAGLLEAANVQLGVNIVIKSLVVVQVDIVIDVNDGGYLWLNVGYPISWKLDISTPSRSSGPAWFKTTSEIGQPMLPTA